MRRLRIAFGLTLLLGFQSLLAQSNDVQPCFVLQQLDVDVGGRKPISVLFKLDTVHGDVWRLDNTNFAQIKVIGPTSLSEQETGKDSPEKGLVDKMEQIKIPEVDLRQANMRDVVRFLQDTSRDLDPDKQGINFVLKLPDDTAAPGASETADNDTETNVPLVTFSARYISLLEALKFITDVTGLRYRIEGRTVVIAPVGPPICSITRIYNIPPRIFSIVLEHPAVSGSTNQPALDTVSAWKQFFSDRGLAWPEDVSLVVFPEVGKVVVRNMWDSAIFDEILSDISYYPPGPGRYRLDVFRGATDPQVILLDTGTGHTWRYEVIGFSQKKKRIEADGFRFIPARENMSETGPDDRTQD